MMKISRKKRFALLITVLAGILLMTGCGSTGENSSRTGNAGSSISARSEIIDNGDGSYSCDLFAMDTVMNLKAFGEEDARQALEDASAEITRLDQELNVTSESSAVWALNQRVTDTVTGDTAAVLEQSLRLAALTGGTFDPTIYPVVRAWGFTTQNYRVPEASEIEELLTHVGYGNIRSSRQENGDLQILFPDDQMQIDTGGIGKGYASERIYEIMKQDGIQSAVVSLGGNVMTIGKKPDGSRWNVAIEDPFNSGGSDYAGVIQLNDQFAITSGGYQRFFEENGKTYIHIMDPATGQPVDNDLSSVTIISDSGTEGDALSTALYVMGLDQAISFWKTSELDFEIILIDADREIYLSEGIADHFHSDNPDYQKLHTVSR